MNGLGSRGYNARCQPKCEYPRNDALLIFLKLLYMLLVASVSVVDVGTASDDCSVDVVGSICLRRGPSHTHVRYGTHIVDGGRYRDERQVMNGGIKAGTKFGVKGGGTRAVDFTRDVSRFNYDGKNSARAVVV